MPTPPECRFSESHEWFQADGEIIIVGLSQHAVDELTDITYVEMKPVGTTVAAMDSLGEVESVKTTSDVYTAIAGEIVAVNQQAVDDPALLNADPQGEGWLVKIKPADPAPLKDLMDQATYEEKYPLS